MEKCDLLIYDDGNMFGLEQMLEALGSDLYGEMYNSEDLDFQNVF